MICDRCGKSPATQAISRIENGQKRVLYRCDVCAAIEAAPPPVLNRPCAQCKKREGHIKLVRIRSQGRVVTYLCDICATTRK